MTELLLNLILENITDWGSYPFAARRGMMCLPVVFIIQYLSIFFWFRSVLQHPPSESVTPLLTAAG